MRRGGQTSARCPAAGCFLASLDLTPGLAGIADGFTLFMLAIDGLPPLDHGLSVCVSSWQRVTDNAIPPRGKIGGSYVNASLMMVREGTLITPPVSGDILEGINRRAVLELAADLGMPVVDREIDRTELYVADELFLCGTRMQIAWIAAVDRRQVGSGRRGPITTRLADRFETAVRGTTPEYAHWMTRLVP